MTATQRAIKVERVRVVFHDTCWAKEVVPQLLFRMFGVRFETSVVRWWSFGLQFFGILLHLDFVKAFCGLRRHGRLRDQSSEPLSWTNSVQVRLPYLQRNFLTIPFLNPIGKWLFLPTNDGVLSFFALNAL